MPTREQGFVAYLLSEIGDSLLDADHVKSLSVADNRSDESLLSRNGNTDIDVISVDNGITAVWTLNGCVDGWKVPHGEDTGAGERAHEAKLNASLLQDLVLVELAELHQGGHVNLVEGGQGGGGVLGLLQALSDSQAHAVHLDLVGS